MYTESTTLKVTIFKLALEEIANSVFSFQGTEVNGDDGVDINITFPSLIQAFEWARAYGVLDYLNLNTSAYGPVTSLEDAVRVYVEGYWYGVRQLGRKEYRSFEFGSASL